MIKLKSINKYYNRGKINQNHVCKDVNLEFNDSGLHVILGTSGSGKTTILNLISGMDKFDEGILYFEDVIFTKYNAKQWDHIRKEKIGYIYQNYHLLKDLSVYENIEPVLKMQGITDPAEIRERVTYLLQSVGMTNYEDRLVKQLSGGQQQRVAFARALSSDPSVILADEPTGNLDSKTTVELMTIIKKISKTRLVILVTHEQALADYFADRIIEIENGKIMKDYQNKRSESLDLIQEQIIYLLDYERTNLDNESLDLSRYSDKPKKEQEKIKLDLIERNETLYVKVDAKHKRRIKYIDNESEIELKQESSKTHKEKETAFIIKSIEKREDKKENVISLKDSFRYAIRKMNKVNYGGKMLYLVLMMVGIVVALSVGLIGEIFHVEEPFSTINRNYITVITPHIKYDEILKLNDIDGVEYVSYIYKPIYFNIETPKYYEVRPSLRVEAIPVDINYFDESELIYGSMPTGYEVVIDRSVADNLLKENEDRGINTYEDIINSSFKMQAYSLDTDHAKDSALYFKISGIAQDNSLSIWIPQDLIYSLATPAFVTDTVIADGFHLISGEMPQREQYLVLNNQYPAILNGDVPYNVGNTIGNFYVSGVYEYVKDGKTYNLSGLAVTNTDFLKYQFFMYNSYIKENYTFLLYTKDVDTTLQTLKDLGYNASANEYDKTLSQQIKFDQNGNIYILSLVGLAMAALSIFLIMRSSLISRIYEVSVYRSIGASKKEVRKMFIVEIFITTTFSSIVGFLIMILLLNQAESGISNINFTHFTILSTMFGILGLYMINTIFGLIPVNMLLRKTPSDIMRKYDL